MPGTLFVVATPIGNLEDISARAIRVLGQVALIAAEDTRRTARLLAHYGIATPTTSLHEHNERQKSSSLLVRLTGGEDIALVSDAGTPTVSDPGEQLIRTAIAAGVRVEPIPGPSAVMSALAASGLPSDTFTFMGFPPVKGTARRHWFDSLAEAGRTVVFFEAPHRIIRTLTELQAAVGDREIAVARELTKSHEELVRGPISHVLSTGVREQGELTVVVSIGQKTETGRLPAPSDAEMLAEFCQTPEHDRIRRRTVIGRMAFKYGMSPKEVYSAVERAKKLVE
ncbi:MAG: 16S rRNA (cytidine(1402)-2'-O)-methyltransferase [Vicinamibacterales bacterium]